MPSTRRDTLASMKATSVIIGACLIGTFGLLLISRSHQGHPQTSEAKDQDCYRRVVPHYAALLPLSGNGAEQGQWCQRGFELARDTLRRQGNIFEVQTDDTKGDAKEAISAYHNSRMTQALPIVFTWGSSVGMALSPITNAEHVIQIGVATTTPKYRTVGDLTFRVFPSAEGEAHFLGEIISKLFPKERIAALYVENDYGLGTFEAWCRNEVERL